ncbi:Uma2 family endonuclease [Aneurinibacillus danicus]|jgi:Uma2 family endonuclease|uniref:Putative restriction endonuclease domain-containing protein n=1 Tax=Aneurinibacillus danicus TaxID=267746 RepID=A0A511VA58_9BACL|nr:Uma2 family endonuclease [Aneurinibacillus danicus]GEN35796.1 hypothetical protein ADA01nite_32560 [Aneurinibacillus danicus]
MKDNKKGTGKKLCYADYLEMSQPEEWWEIIDGIPYSPNPTPPVIHQKVLGGLMVQIGEYLRGRKEEMLFTIDVRMPEKGQTDMETTNVVQPDIAVVCDPRKIDEKGCMGSPDWIIEIVSLATIKRDKMEKFQLYERMGVLEYWIVYPREQFLEVYRLGEKYKYSLFGIFTVEDCVSTSIFDDIAIKLNKVFQPENRGTATSKRQ